LLLFDFVILGAFVAFLFVRLWSVLGERPPKKRGEPSPSRPTVILSEDQVEITKRTPPTKSDFYPGFDEARFLDGVAGAFHLILDAHHKQDAKKLATLVTAKLLKEAFTEPSAETPQETCLVSAHVTHKRKTRESAFVTVRLISQQVFETETREAEDVWTFQRSLKSTNPNWKLCAVEQTVGAV
jgi:predicted lipid-binding transport protein (Tim44 family)